MYPMHISKNEFFFELNMNLNDFRNSLFNEKKIFRLKLC